MNINSLTIKAQEALQSAVNLAKERGQQAVEPMHLLSVLIAEDDSLSAFLLGRVGVNVRSLREEARKAVEAIPRVSGGNGEQYFSGDTSKVIQRAVDFTRNFNDKYASVEHLLLALVAERGAAADMLKRGGATEKDLIEAISSAYDHDGLEETIVITRSNRRATIYNNGIRARILWREEELSSGDRLMVARNNYFWTAGQKETDFIANGEIIRLRRIRRTYEMYGFRFADVQAEFQEQDTEQGMDLKVLLDTLQNDSPALTKEQNDRLFYAVLEDYMDVPTKAGKLRKMKADPHYNALQVKYAYAITCHKAQGGQWRNVFLDIGYITEEMLGEDFYRWLYTAFTRATECLYLVNLPSEFIE